MIYYIPYVSYDEIELTVEQYDLSVAMAVDFLMIERKGWCIDPFIDMDSENIIIVDDAKVRF